MATGLRNSLRGRIDVVGSRLYSRSRVFEPIGVKADNGWVCSSSKTSISGGGNVGAGKQEENEVSMDGNLVID